MTTRKAACSKWASALTEMGFTKDQVAAALNEPCCKSLQQAVDWLCSGPRAYSDSEGSDSPVAEVQSRTDSGCGKAEAAQRGGADSSSGVQVAAAEQSADSSTSRDVQGSLPRVSRSIVNVNPVWAAMSQRFKENVSALKRRQCRRSSVRPPLPSEGAHTGRSSLSTRRQSVKRGLSPSLPDALGRKRAASRSPHLERPSLGRRVRSVASSAPSSPLKSVSSQDSSAPELSVLPQQPLPLPTPQPARSKKRRASGQRWQSRQTREDPEEGRRSETGVMDAVVQAPTPLANAVTPDSAPCDFCVFKNKRLRSKTPPPAESRYRGRRKRLRSKSVDPVCKEKMSTEVSEEQRKDQARVHEKSKCYRVTWAWKLSDMGFSDEQIEAAISECSTQREAIEWLCSN